MLKDNKEKFVLFDLDGTLLPMDQDEFIKAYFSLLAKKLSFYGYEPQKLVKTVWHGTESMIKNDGSRTNEEAFWQTFSSELNKNAADDLPLFDDFYHNEFNNAKKACGFNGYANETVQKIKASGYKTVLATNPVFPLIAVKNRLGWAGIDPGSFEFITSYENIGYCKPNPMYYLEICKRINAEPRQCVMVGNDVTEDMVAKKTGMEVFLLTDCLINKNNEDIEQFPHGGFKELAEFFGI